MIDFSMETIDKDTYRIVTRNEHGHIVSIVERYDPRGRTLAKMSLFGLVCRGDRRGLEFNNENIDRFLFLEQAS